MPGSCLGQMDRAMQSFRHPQAVRDLTWDLANVGRVRKYLPEITDPADRALADRGECGNRWSPRFSTQYCL
eukprot:SAG22_NODE_23_length_31399_cov_35.631313_10_plen_71_part_00